MSNAARRAIMADPVRVGPEEIRTKVETGEALLVCAYENDWQFRKMQLEGAISLSDFKSRLNSISDSKEIVFYCA
jgi:hypothetical protein